MTASVYDPSMLPPAPPHPCQHSVAALSAAQRPLPIRRYGSPPLMDDEVEFARSIEHISADVLSPSSDQRHPYTLNFGEKVRLTLQRRDRMTGVQD